MASYIQTALIKGRERFGFPRDDIPAAFCQRYFFDVYYLTNGYEAPTDRNCRVCGKIGHIAKDCPHSKSNRRAEQKKEEEQRITNQEGEKPDLSRKPFNAGSSRPRSTSAPNKQAQQGMMMLGHLSPPLRPLVPYPLTPELQAHSQLHQWRVASDSLPMQQHVGSPVRGQEPHAELSRQILAQSPPNVSRNVMWPVGRNSPPSAAREPHFQGHQLQSPHVGSPGMPVPTIGSPQRMAHPLLSQGNFPSIPAANLGSPQRLSHGNSHAAPGTPQQMLQQRPLAHPSGMSPLVLGSPPQHTSQQPAPHPQGLVEPAFGTHMVSSPYWPYWFYY